MVRILFTCISAAIFLAGCATMEGRPASSAERASCTEMEKEMGLGKAHDHAEMKGMGRNPMNMSHARCQQILAEPG